MFHLPIQFLGAWMPNKEINEWSTNMSIKTESVIE